MKDNGLKAKSMALGSLRGQRRILIRRIPPLVKIAMDPSIWGNFCTVKYMGKAYGFIQVVRKGKFQYNWYRRRTSRFPIKLVPESQIPNGPIQLSGIANSNTIGMRTSRFPSRALHKIGALISGVSNMLKLPMTAPLMV